MSDADVLIAGAGPTGLAAALFLTRRGRRVRVFDPGPPTETSRALVVNPRSLELLEGTGVTEAVVAEGRPVKGVRFHRNWRRFAGIDVTHVHPRHAMTVLPQARTEALLTEALAALGVEVERGAALRDPGQDGNAAFARLEGGAGGRLSAPLLLGADGAHSDVRHALGVRFDGDAFPEPWPLVDLELNDPLELDHAHVELAPGGLIFMLALRPGLWRVFGNLPDLLDRLPPGSRPGAVAWRSEFRIHHRRAVPPARGRLALAGDAAHLHSPVGARGMNLGIEDAFAHAAAADRFLSGDARAMERWAAERGAVHRDVVTRIRRLTTLARGRPAWMGLLRFALLPALTSIGPLRRRVRAAATGLDHPAPTP